MGSRCPVRASLGARARGAAATPAGNSSARERLAELALDEHGDGTAAQVHRQLPSMLPEAVVELVGPEHKAVLPGPDVEEERLDSREIVAKQDRLQARVQLAAVEPAGEDAGDEG